MLRPSTENHIKEKAQKEQGTFSLCSLDRFQPDHKSWPLWEEERRVNSESDRIKSVGGKMWQ